MAIELISRVWADKTITDQSELLILLALADYSNKDGTAWPSVNNLALKSRLTTRGVRYILNRLTESRRLKITEGKGPHGVNLYTILFPKGAERGSGVNHIQPEPECTEGLNHIPSPPERGSANPSVPVIEPSKNRSKKVISIWGHTKIIEAKEELRKGLVNAFAYESAHGLEWNDPDKKKEYYQLGREIKQHRVAISQAGG